MGAQFVAGDTASKLQVTCKDKESGAVIDLNTRTAWLRWRVDGTAFTGNARQMDVVGQASAGVVEYQFQTGELESGTMEFEVEIREANGKSVRSLDPIRITVKQALVA